jgi:hypothetical protein
VWLVSASHGGDLLRWTVNLDDVFSSGAGAGAGGGGSGNRGGGGGGGGSGGGGGATGAAPAFTVVGLYKLNSVDA